MKSQAEMFMKCCSFGNPKLNDSRSWRKLAEKWVEIVELSLTHTKQHVVTVNIYIINCLFVAKNGQCDYSNMNIVARCTIRNTVEPHNFSSTKKKKKTHTRAHAVPKADDLPWAANHPVCSTWMQVCDCCFCCCSATRRKSHQAARNNEWERAREGMRRET